MRALSSTKTANGAKEASRVMAVVRRSSFSSFLFLCFHLLATFWQTSDAVGSAMIEAINCSTSGNYTPAGAYAANLNQFLAALPENAVSKNGGFFSGAVGDGKATVYGLGMCSADYPRADCSDCLAATAGSNNGGLPNRCPGSTTVLAVFDKCLVRYSDTNFLGTAQTDVIYSSGGAAPSSLMAYSGKMKDRLQLLTGEAVTSPQRFAASATDPPYALMQCTWDLSPDKCKQCLDVLSANASDWWTVTIDGKRKSFSCTVRYSNTSFMVLPFNGGASSSPTSSVEQTTASAAASRSQSSRTVVMVVGSVLAIVLVVFLASLLWHLRRSRCLPGTQVEDGELNNQSQTPTTDVEDRKLKNQSQTPTTNVEDGELNNRRSQTPTTHVVVAKEFTYEELAKATGEFTEDKKLGEGCFGAVYEGTLPGIRETVAIKKILDTSPDQAKRAFKNEIDIMRQMNHRNILRLLGWCDQDDHLLLIYEKMMGNLEDYLYPKTGTTDVEVHCGANGLELDWPTRRNIIVGIASGLAHLHTGSRTNVIIHRDIKPGNILLDKHFNATLADFGLVAQFRHTQTSHRTDNVIGTRAYIDPAYTETGRATGKCDVYSFGVVLLEIVSRAKPSMSDNGKYNTLIDMVQRRNWNDILRNYPGKFDSEIKHVLDIGLLCVRPNPHMRPHIGKVCADLMAMVSTQTTPSVSNPNPSSSRANEREPAASSSNNRQPSEVECARLPNTHPANSNSQAREEADTASLLQLRATI